MPAADFKSLRAPRQHACSWLACWTKGNHSSPQPWAARRITITNTYSYSLCGSLLILAGDMCGRESCGGLPASCWMSVMARPWVWPPCSRPRLRDLCWQVSNVVGCERCFCKTGLRVDECTKSYMWESHWSRSRKVERTGRDGPQTGRLRRMGEWRGHSRIVSLEHGSPRR
jgi:hypothetical protein